MGKNEEERNTEKNIAESTISRNKTANNEARTIKQA